MKLSFEQTRGLKKTKRQFLQTFIKGSFGGDYIKQNSILFMENMGRSVLSLMESTRKTAREELYGTWMGLTLQGTVES